MVAKKSNPNKRFLDEEDIQDIIDVESSSLSTVILSPTKKSRKEKETPIHGTMSCCNRGMLAFTPLAMDCHYGCNIAPYAKYYYNEDRKLLICTSCFKAKTKKGTTFTLKDSAIAKKSEFYPLRNSDAVAEPSIRCARCLDWFHEVCALHCRKIWQIFLCPKCSRECRSLKTNPFKAENLAETRLSSFIEAKLNEFGDRNDVVEKLRVRVLYAADSRVKLLPEFQKHCPEGHEGFPYRSKAIYAFQEQEGKEVAFFAFIVHEFFDSPAPNQRKIYLAYLDSTNMFCPRNRRTMAYHTILLAYFNYMKNLGFQDVHIWVCPPNKYTGSDYIFHCHPRDMKFPDIKRLQTWYKDLLNKGMEEGIVLEYTSLYDQVARTKDMSLFDIPYFEGDFWPNFIEEAFQHPAVRPSLKIRNRLTNGLKETALKKDFDGTKWKVLKEVHNAKDKFLVARLNEFIPSTSMKGLLDPDPTLSCPLFDNGRDRLMELCRTNHFEFSSERRAKYSTLHFLAEVHDRTGPIRKDTLVLRDRITRPDNPKTVTCVDVNPSSATLQSDPDMVPQIATTLLEAVFHGIRCGCDECANFCIMGNTLGNHFMHWKQPSGTHTDVNEENCRFCDVLIAALETHIRHCNRIDCRLPSCQMVDRSVALPVTKHKTGDTGVGDRRIRGHY